MKERIVLQILLSIALAISVYFIGEWVARCLFDVAKIDLHWGLTIRYSLLVFIIVTIIMGYLSFVLNKYYLLIIFSLCIIIFSFILGTIAIRPHRTLLLIFSGIIGLTLPIIIIKR